MPKISVIVPVYNTEQYLHRCIDSILAQTFTDFELLLIDDGSKDSSGRICDEYALKDSRIRVFHKKNGGVSSARNLGLDNAKGEWISFVDSDDWVENKYIEELFSNGQFDFVACYYKAEDWDTWVSQPFDNCSYYGNNIHKCLNLNIKRMVYNVCKLFNNEIIKENHIRFDTVISYGEDTIFTFEYLAHVKSIKTISSALYHYEYSTPNSLTKQESQWQIYSYTINKMCKTISMLEKQHTWEGTEIKEHFTWRFLRKHLNHIQQSHSLIRIAKELNKVNENTNVQQMHTSSNIENRSSSRRLFDYIMSKKLYLCCALFLKTEFILLKLNCIRRR